MPSHSRDRLAVGDRSLEAAWWTPDTPAAPPLVLLHEGLGSVAMWRGFPTDLAARTSHAVMAYSRFGHGRSDRPEHPHTITFMHDEARLLPAILDAAALTQPVLFGHSDGGSIALIAAAESPARVHALILEAPHVFVEDVSILSIRRTTTNYENSDLRKRLARYHDEVDVAFRGWSDVWLDPAFRTWNLESLLPRITCPVLVIQGEEDEYGTAAQVEAIAMQVAGAVEVIMLPGCGHSPHRDRPDAVLDLAVSFLSRVS